MKFKPSLSLFERLKLVRSSSSGAFPVTEQDLAKYQDELEQGIVQEGSIKCSSSSSFEDCIVHVTLDEVETTVQAASCNDEMNNSGRTFDMSLLPQKTLTALADTEKDPKFIDGAIEFMYDNTERGEDNVLLLSHARKPLTVQDKAKKVILQPLCSSWSFVKSLARRVKSFHIPVRNSSWREKRRNLDRTRSFDEKQEEEMLEFDNTPSGPVVSFRSSNFDDSAGHSSR
jgi:hypothetical protein